MIGLVKKNLFIIAEAGVNHNGNLEIAKKMIDIASISGADAVKLALRRSEAGSTYWISFAGGISSAEPSAMQLD